ncbi:MAG: ABC transporter permease [Anaerolineales bacterium]|nr:ABC transporter permease [Anaerolineales bacterium]
MFGSLPLLTPLVLALRNMRVRWMRTALTCLGIVLGVAVILAIAITNESTLRSLRSVFDEASGRASLVVLPTAGDGEGLDETAAARAAGQPGVVTAAPTVIGTTLLARDVESWQFAVSLSGQAVGSSLQILGVDPELDPLVRQYALAGGRWLQGEAYEAVLSETYAGDKDLRVGDDLVIVAAGGQERLRIVGLVRREGAGLLNDGQVAFVPLPVAQDLFGRAGYLDEISIVAALEVANAPAALEALKDRLGERLGRGYDVTYPAERGRLVTQMLSTYQQGLSFFSVIALFVGAFLIYNAFTMTILERTRELGLLRALGMSSGQVLGLVLTEAVTLAVLGSALGLGFGMALARGLIAMLGVVLASDLSAFSVPPGGLLQSLLVGGLVTVGSALAPAAQAARTSPLEALRTAGAQAAGRPRRPAWLVGGALIFVAWAALYALPVRPEAGFAVGGLAILLLLLGATLMVPAVVGLAERLVRPAAVLAFGAEGVLGSGNVRRATGRTALTVAALLVGIAMVIATSSLSGAFTHDLTSWVETALGGDLYVRSPQPMREQFERQLAALPGVEGITKIRYFAVRAAASALASGADGDTSLIYAAIDPATYQSVGEFQFAANQGDPRANWARFARGDALFISTVVADRYQVQQGDTLRLVTRRGEHDFYVAAVAVDFTGQGYIVTGHWDDMRRWFAQSGVDRFTIGVAPGYTSQQVAETIEARYQAARNVSVETTEDFKQKITGLSAQSFRLFDVLGLIGLVVAALGVINTLMMNVLERQREIGSLRSLGLTRWQITKMVLAEAGTLGLIGGAFGLAFGYVLSQVFVDAVNAMVGYDLQYIFIPAPFLAGAGLALGVSQVAALYPAWKAAGVNIVEAIKHE